MITIRGKKLPLNWIFLAGAFLIMWLFMLIPGWGEWYYRHVYVHLSSFLSRFSSLFPFSVSDCLIYGSILFLLFYTIYSILRRKSWKNTLRFVATYLLWIFVWFYFAWGLNYFRDDFYERTNTSPVEFSKETFQHFLTTYTDSLNASYVRFDSIDRKTVANEVREGYGRISDRFGFAPVRERLNPKPMLVNSLMTGTGVLGYMGPFFSEYTLNKDLLPVQYPFTYAHEMAHMLGIANEAEANLYAYLVCTSSKNPEVRFSGYLGLLNYVLKNAGAVLDQEEYDAWRQTINPAIRDLFNAKGDYWEARYNPVIGAAQHFLYNLYLKGNNISSGQENYSEVIGLLMALRAHP